MKMKNLRTGVAAAVGGAVLMAGLLVGASLALADDADEPGTTAGEAVTGEEARDECDGFMKDRFRRMAGGLEDLADELGLPLEEIREQLEDGMTLEDLASDLGVDLDQVFADLRETALAEIDERVTAGDLTEEQGDSLKERIESFELGEWMSSRRGFGQEHRIPDYRGFLDDLDIDLDGLRDLIESGTTLEDALESLGVDIESLVDEAIANVTEHIDELLADGRITQERADEMKESLQSFELGDGFPFGRRGFGLDGFRGPGGHGFRDGLTDDANAAGALLDV